MDQQGGADSLGHITVTAKPCCCAGNLALQPRGIAGSCNMTGAVNGQVQGFNDLVGARDHNDFLGAGTHPGDAVASTV